MLCFLMILYPLLAMGADIPVQRADLQPLVKSLCDERAADITELLRASKVADLHVQGGLLSLGSKKSGANKAHVTKRVQSYVVSIAAKRTHAGYAVASCSKNPSRYAFLTTIAPVPWNKLSTKKGSSFCKKPSIIQAANTIEGIPSVASGYNSKIPAGFFASVYCENSSGRLQATYLTEPKNQPMTLGQFGKAVTKKSKEGIANQMRLLAGLHKVKTAKMPQKLLNIVLDGTIEHSAATPQKASEILKGRIFIGEIKVFAKNWTEALWHFWRSPSHRQMLYSRKAKKIYFAQRPLAGSSKMHQFAIIVVR